MIKSKFLTTESSKNVFQIVTTTGKPEIEMLPQPETVISLEIL